MDHVDSLPEADVVKRLVEVIGDIEYKRCSPFERCCLLNRMASLVSAHGLLKVLDSVRLADPEGGTRIVDGVLDWMRHCRWVAEFRFDASPPRYFESLGDEFKRVLETLLVDGSIRHDERVLTVCADVDGLLLIRCADEFARVLLECEMALCQDDRAGACAEKFYGESRQAYQLHNPIAAFQSDRPGVFSRLSGASSYWDHRSCRYRVAVAEALASFGNRWQGPADLLTMHGVPDAVRAQVRFAVECGIREGLCLAVFPGTKTAYNQSIGKVLGSVWSRVRSYRDWWKLRYVTPAGDATDEDDPIHRFWRWTNEVLRIKNVDALTQLLAEAAAHLSEFDQIAFDQCAYGDCYLVFTWLVMREYVYSRRGDLARTPPCCFSPKRGESVFRLTSFYGLLGRDLRQLLTICRRLGGSTWDAIRRYSKGDLLPRLMACDKASANALEELLHTDPQNVRFCDGH
jgi:hypothetical protein